MEYEIKGGAFPIVICTLQKGETMKNETGAMAFMTSDMKMETSTGGGLLKGLGRALAGDTLFLNFFTAQSDNEQIGFSACTPGKIMSIRLDGSNTIILRISVKLKVKKSALMPSLTLRLKFRPQPFQLKRLKLMNLLLMVIHILQKRLEETFLIII